MIYKSIFSNIGMVAFGISLMCYFIFQTKNLGAIVRINQYSQKIDEKLDKLNTQWPSANYYQSDANGTFNEQESANYKEFPLLIWFSGLTSCDQATSYLNVGK